MTILLDPAVPAGPHFSLAPFQRTWLRHTSEVPPDEILLPLIRTMPGLLLWSPDDTVLAEDMDLPAGSVLSDEVLLRRFLDLLLHLSRARRLSGEALRSLWIRQQTPVVRAAIFLSGELALSGWNSWHQNGSNWWYWDKFPDQVLVALRALTPAQRNAWGYRSAARAIVGVLLTNPGVWDLPAAFNATRRLQLLGLCLEDGAADFHAKEILDMLTWTAGRSDFAPPADVLTPFLLFSDAGVRAWAQMALHSAAPEGPARPTPESVGGDSVQSAANGDRAVRGRPGGHPGAR